MVPNSCICGSSVSFFILIYDESTNSASYLSSFVSFFFLLKNPPNPFLETLSPSVLPKDDFFSSFFYWSFCAFPYSICSLVSYYPLLLFFVSLDISCYFFLISSSDNYLPALNGFASLFSALPEPVAVFFL